MNFYEFVCLTQLCTYVLVSLLSKNELKHSGSLRSAQEHLWALKSIHEHSWVLMSTENYGAKALCMVCGMDVMVLCSWMLIKAHECCWCHEAMFMCAHGCLWVLMNVQKYSWVWHHGTISTHEHYWGPMATLEHLWALINNIEQSWSWHHGTNSPHEHWQAFMSMVPWHNIPLIAPLHHT